MIVLTFFHFENGYTIIPFNNTYFGFAKTENVGASMKKFKMAIIDIFEPFYYGNHELSEKDIDELLKILNNPYSGNSFSNEKGHITNVKFDTFWEFLIYYINNNQDDIIIKNVPHIPEYRNIRKGHSYDILYKE